VGDEMHDSVADVLDGRLDELDLLLERLIVETRLFWATLIRLPITDKS
jgi:hypothetical protein